MCVCVCVYRGRDKDSHAITIASMGQSSSDADNCSRGQEFSIILQKARVRYRVQNSPPQDPILKQVSPAHIIKHSFLKINVYNILQSTSCSSKCFIPFRLPEQSGVRFYHPIIVLLEVTPLLPDMFVPFAQGPSFS